MTMSTSQLLHFLTLVFLASVNADYVVYPRIQNNLRLNAGITNSMNSLLGTENVQTFISNPRGVYEFWLVKATASQAVVVREMVGVSIFTPTLGITGWNTDAVLRTTGH